MISNGIPLKEGSEDKVDAIPLIPEVEDEMTVHKMNDPEGDNITNPSLVKIHYTGRLKDGTIFDTSQKNEFKPYEFKSGAGRSIKCWDELVTELKKGSIATFTCP